MSNRVAWFLKIGLLLVLGFVAWSGWYFYRKGFSRKWRGYLSAELRKHGVEVSINRLTLDPLRGLIAQEVEIYDSPRRRWVVAALNQATVDLSVADLIRGQPFLNAIDLRNAMLMIPVDSRDKKAPKIQVTRVSARMYFLGNRLTVSQAEGLFEGIRVGATGTLLHGEEIASVVSAEAPPLSGYRSRIERVVSELRTLEFLDAEPSVRLDFNGSLADLAKMRVEAVFRARELWRGRYGLREAELAAELQDGILSIERLLLRDDVGELRLQARFAPGSGEASFRMTSDCDLMGLLDAYAKLGLLREAAFYGPVKISAEGAGRLWENAGKIWGSFSLPRVGVRSLVLESASGAFSWQPGQWFLRDVHLEHRAGSVDLDAMCSPERFQLRLESDLNPHLWAPLVGDPVFDWLKEWRFVYGPWITLRAEGATPAWENLRIDGKAILGRCTFRGTEYRGGMLNFEVAQGRLEYRGLELAPLNSKGEN